MIDSLRPTAGRRWLRQTGLFGLSDQLKRLSDCVDPLETMARVVDFELFRPALEKVLAYGNGAKGGRPPYDPVATFKVLILAAQNNVSDARMEFLIRDRLSWLRFLGFDLGVPTPDENTIRLFREKLTRVGAIDALFVAFDRSLRERGYLPMGGQIVDATLVAAPKQRNTAAEKDAIKAGKRAAEIWPNAPAKAAQKDTDARWTLKFAKARALPDGRPGIDIAIPSFGYKSSIAICRRYGFIRRGKVTDGARFDRRMLRDAVTRDNIASDVWADTAYRSRTNEAWLKSTGRVSRIHRKKPRGKPMSPRTAGANAKRSAVRARIEHVLARQKDQMGLFIRTIGIARAEVKVTLANLACNIDRLIFHERRVAMGQPRPANARPGLQPPQTARSGCHRQSRPPFRANITAAQHVDGGAQLGYTGNNGTGDTDYGSSITARTQAPGTGAFRNGQGYGGAVAEFDGQVTGITSFDQGSGGGAYTVRSGDTLAGIATGLWGDASLWYKLAAANGLSGDASLIAGQTMNVPAGVIRSGRTASTFKPYDPAEALGDTSPASPQPKARPKNNKCGMFGQILLVAIAVAVTIASKGMPINLAGSILGLAAGSTGAAIAGGALAGVAGSTISQGIRLATGLQSKFDFAGVAVAGIGAGVGGTIGRTLGAAAGSLAGRTISATASAIAGGAARSLITGTSFGDNILAALPDAIGQAIGGYAGSKLAGTGRGIRAALAKDSMEKLRDIAGDNPALRAPLNEYEAALNRSLRNPGSVEARKAMDRAARSLIVAAPDNSPLADYGRMIDSVSRTAEDGETVVNGYRNYLFGSTIDRGGIWLGENINDLKTKFGEFVAANPGVGVALALAEEAFAVVAPAKFVAGKALDYFKDQAGDYVAGKMVVKGDNRMWNADKSHAGGTGFVFAAGVALSGLSALGGGLVALGRGHAAKGAPVVSELVETNSTGLAKAGRSGRQARLRELAADPKVSSADRGWIKQEMNSIARGQRSNIRVSPGKVLGSGPIDVRATI